MDAAEALDPRNSGTRLAEMDQLDVAGKLAELGTAPARQRLYDAQARLAGTKADAAEGELAIQRRLQATLGQGGGGAPVDPVDRLEQYATAALQSGSFNAGGKAAQQAATIRAAQARASASQTAQMAAQAAEQRKQLELAEGIYRDADTPEKWDEANTRYQMLTNQPSPFEHLEFEPGLNKKLSDAMLSQKDKLTEQARAATLKAQEQNYASAAKARNARIAQLNASADLIRDRIATLKKNGGNGAAGLAELRGLQAQIARERLKGRTAETPDTVIPPAGDRVPGRFYQTPKGPMQWHQNGWVPAGQTMPPAQTGIERFKSSISNMLNAPIDDDDEDDDE